jgi:membrane-bound ClpP family serine protease
MNYGFWAIISLSLAIILIAAEIFLPSGGLISILMIISYVSAIYCAYMAWWEPNPVLFWGFSGFSVVAIPTTLFLAFVWLEKSAWGKRILLEAPTSDEVTPFAADELRLKKFIGEKTTTLTPLSPGGMISINGDRIHCYSQGMMIDANQLVKVIGVAGSRLIVEPTTLDETPLNNSLLDDELNVAPSEASINTSDIFLSDAQKNSTNQPIDFETR